LSHAAPDARLSGQHGGLVPNHAAIPFAHLPATRRRNAIDVAANNQAGTKARLVIELPPGTDDNER
jgi:hypothetical protein